MTSPRRASLARRFGESKVLFPLIALGLILLFDLFAVPGFFALDTVDGHLFGNLVDIPRNGSTIMLLAMGMTLVIATGGVDLSVGAIMAISASVAAIMIQPDLQSLSHDPSFSQFPAAGRRPRDARSSRPCAASGTGSWSPTPGSSPWWRP